MRVDYASAVPGARTALLGLEKVVHESDLDPRMVELVKVRASQINGCAHCLEMHTAAARALGEDQQRLDLVAVWREADCFSPQERAALGWCEALTLIADTGAPDAVYDAVAKHFEPAQIVALTLGIAAINAWNRMNIALRISANGGEGG
ncbi:MAG TPA: carboxymuconolactone decarboxylase family protein [Acidimicrobiales bacterium]|nr:carboxymuconolactone decarboxylase family protein [Acidimicrobiales bacterium]